MDQRIKTLSAQDLKTRLSDPAELALIDVREFGQYGEGHPFFSVNMPYSRLEIDAARRLPRRATPIVLFDAGDGVAARAAGRLKDMGYVEISVLAGGAPTWAAAGYTLFKGVNVPSKTFGELVEEMRHTPRVAVEDFIAMRERGDPILLLDGRTLAEHRSFTIPGSMSCPNAELGLRLPPSLSPETTLVVHCAGRTRSIIGAETLRALGVANRVVALENGTQGWELAGRPREHGADRPLAPEITPEMRDAAIARAAAFCTRHGIPRIDSETLEGMRRQADRTLYLLDVRAREEFQRASVPGATHAPGGQLIQATDHWLAVRGARVVVWDDCEIRAAFAAYWLRAMGWEASMLTGPVETAPPETDAASDVAPTDDGEVLDAAATRRAQAEGARLIDVRSSAAYRQGHIDGAIWSIRPRLAALPGDIADARFVVIGDEAGTDGAGIAALAARELLDLGAESARRHLGAPDAWRAAGLRVVTTPDAPPDPERIDHLFFVAKRHSGDLDHARAYLAWEQQLVSQLDAQERGVYRLGGREA